MSVVEPIKKPSLSGTYAGSKNRFVVAPKQRSVQDFKPYAPKKSEVSILDVQATSGKVDELSLSEGAYDMANLQPEETGLTFVVWISPRGRARHGARVKVSRIPITDRSEASVSIAEPVEVKAGELSNSDLAQLKLWIDLNRENLLKFWNGEIQYTSQILRVLKPINSP